VAHSNQVQKSLRGVKKQSDLVDHSGFVLSFIKYHFRRFVNRAQRFVSLWQPRGRWLRTTENREGIVSGRGGGVPNGRGPRPRRPGVLIDGDPAAASKHKLVDGGALGADHQAHAVLRDVLFLYDHAVPQQRDYCRAAF
jgi:hypothetical protein